MVVDRSVEVPGSVETFEVMLAVIIEFDSGSGSEIGDRSGDQRLARLGRVADSLGDVHGDPRDVGAPLFDLAGVHAGSDGHPDLPDGVVDGESALHGSSRAVKGREDTVAGGFDEVTAEAGDLTAGHVVVLVEPFSPETISDSPRLAG